MKYLALAALAVLACSAFADGGPYKVTQTEIRMAEMNLNSPDPAVRERAFWVLADGMRAEDPVTMEKAAMAEPVPVKRRKNGARPPLTSAVSMSFMCDRGCCQPGDEAQFKVYAGGRYYLFGCRESANEGRQELTQYGYVAGDIQAVVGSHTL